MGPDPVRFSFDGRPLEAPRGLTIGGALLANGIVAFLPDPSGTTDVVTTLVVRSVRASSNPWSACCWWNSATG